MNVIKISCENTMGGEPRRDFGGLQLNSNNSGGNQFEDPPEIELEDVPLEIFEEDKFEDKEAELTWMGFIEIAVGQIRSEPEENTPDESMPLFDQVEEKIKKMTPDNSTWYPFLSREYLVGSLFIGYLHKIITRDMYHQIRTILTLYHVILPCWEALRQMRSKIRTLITRTVIEKESVFGQPMFGLKASELIGDDLMNPLVAPHLDFVPEETHGFNVTQPQVSQLFGRINSIWTVQKPSYQTSYYIHTTVFQKMEKSKFYKIREICRTPREAFVHSSNIRTGLNAQHDCHRGGCQLVESEALTNTVERRPTSTKKVELIHCDENQFIINMASLSAAACHRKALDVINESKT
ncbi:hypothetical protein PGTUg99_030554 [Puccinia graminis f. sp. tritici]|uniref:Uncharacterized protein n=1 Tax=Puccinia graminis f. sp. tritici TaxID=56615 RepID=A0A5B0LW20_PUCGR|nr:hypothetical protein PGTUg99_030554 [Puccinia graminis f. sp. tritici]